jgi:dienelactone hydrolase
MADVVHLGRLARKIHAVRPLECENMLGVGLLSMNWGTDPGLVLGTRGETLDFDDAAQMRARLPRLSARLLPQLRFVVPDSGTAIGSALRQCRGYARPMAEIVFFHHSGGLTAGIHAFADSLRAAGHIVHTPDLFEGRTFADVSDGVAYVESFGEGTFARRAAAAVSNLPVEMVYGGASFGAARAAEQVLSRPGAQSAFFLYGAIAPSWWDAVWPAGVAAQAHQAEVDPWREVETEQEFLAAVPNAELFVYPTAGHLFAEMGHPDYDAASAELATNRVLAFLGGRR